MNRTEGRAAAVAALNSLNLFDAVYDHEPQKLDRSPVATVHSRSLALRDFAHGEYILDGQLWVTVWVLIDGDQSAAEAQLDDLVRRAYMTLQNSFEIGMVDGQIPASESGYRSLDGKVYRVERFALVVQEDVEG